MRCAREPELHVLYVTWPPHAGSSSCCCFFLCHAYFDVLWKFLNSLPAIAFLNNNYVSYCHDLPWHFNHFNTLKNLQPISRGFATRPAHTADQYSGCILAKGALVSDLAMRMALVMSCAFLLFSHGWNRWLWLLFQQPSAHMFRNEEVDLLQDSLRKANCRMSSPQICMFRVQFCGLQPVTASCWWVYSNSCNENSRNISVGAATTKSFAQLLTLAQSAGSIILHLSVHAIGLVHWVFVMQGRCGWDTGGCGSDLHLTIPDLKASAIRFSNAKVVNAESNVGIVFENDFGGAHILYRPQLEELLGNGEPLGST